MTREAVEAIIHEAKQRCPYYGEPCGCNAPDGPKMCCDNLDAVEELALTAIRTQQEPDCSDCSGITYRQTKSGKVIPASEKCFWTAPNEPLTPEEVRRMDGKPMWVVCLRPSKYIESLTGWRILEKSISGTFGVWNGDNCLTERDYGTDWLAYRRKPEAQ